MTRATPTDPAPAEAVSVAYLDAVAWNLGHKKGRMLREARAPKTDGSNIAFYDNS